MKKSTSDNAASEFSGGDNPIPAPIIETPQLSGGELGEIQEILVGRQLRNSKEQIESLQTFFTQQIAQLAEDHSQQLAELHQKVGEIQADFTDRLVRQEKEHQSQLHQVTATLGSSESALIDRVSAVSESVTTMHNDLTEKLDKTTADLRTTKVDRESMSNLFGRLATELGDREYAPASINVAENHDAPKTF